jgi:hypothetical protein
MLLNPNYQESIALLAGLIIFGGGALVIGAIGGIILCKTKRVLNSILFVIGCFSLAFSFAPCYFFYCELVDLTGNLYFWIAVVLIVLSLLLPAKKKLTIDE